MERLLFIICAPFILGVLIGVIQIISNIRKSISGGNGPPIDTETDENRELLDREIDGYNQLLIALDKQYQTETDEKKKAAILSKQITTLEKYRKAIEKAHKISRG